MAVFMIMTALNVFNLKYELDTVKKFPENLPSRVGYEIVESKYNNGELAPSTLLLESENTLSDEQIDQFLKSWRITKKSTPSAWPASRKIPRQQSSALP